MRAVGLLAWAEVRRHRGAMVLLVALVAAVSGAVFTAAAGARRTSSVLDRFLDAQGSTDLTVAVSRPRIASDVDVVGALAAQLSTLRGVDDVVAGQTVLPWINDGDEGPR